MNSICLSARAAIAALALLASAIAGAQAQGTDPQPAAVQSAPSFSRAELDQLVAPIALYSDTLLAQVLMASTYPLEVVEAERWVAKNASLKGEALLSALDKERWDASVKALAQVPTVLKMMSDKLDWTQKLGDAFLAQQKDVMASVQRLRDQASDAGNLKSTEQQTVVREQETIVIEQASPEVVYVPAYNPAVVYGTWPYPSYPPYSWGAGYWPYSPVGSALAWGIGVGITASIWNNGCDWNNGNININNNVNVGGNRWRNSGDRNWRHDPGHRRGVNYRDNRTRDKFAKGDRNVAGRRDFRGHGARAAPQLSNRDLNRGRSDNRATPRDRGTRQSTGPSARNRATSPRSTPRSSQRDQYGGRGQYGGRDQYGGRGGRGGYPHQRQASRGYGGGGFDGVGRGGQTRSFSNRGASSRGGRGGGRRR